MEPPGRRVRRFGVRRNTRQTNTLLPLHTSSSQLSNAISCWYCDYKISVLNGPVFRFGQRHARILKGWFSIGIGFGLAALLGILIWELVKTLHLCHNHCHLGSLSRALLFGFSPTFAGLSISLADTGYIIVSTIISVCVHECGHAVSAASEGIQVEYIAIFIAVLFPGALVAFNDELLQKIPHFAALRVYSAGIWHNAICCAACGFVLFLMPLILFPFYIHGGSPVVLSLPSTSPLSGYLSPDDIIMSVDNIPIQNAQDWIRITSVRETTNFENTNNTESIEAFRQADSKKGYCIPFAMMTERKEIGLADEYDSCPDHLTAFVSIPCFSTRMRDPDDKSTGTGNLAESRSIYCLNAKDVVKLEKCGGGWGAVSSDGDSSCICSEEESCLAPVQIPGMAWVEIKYLLSSSPECFPTARKYLLDPTNAYYLEDKCVGTFVFFGDVIAMAQSVSLTSYHPRWGSRTAAYLPYVLERILIWTFHISLALALLNSLPVYFLDGEIILDASLCYFTSLSPRKREKVLRICLLGGTFLSILCFVRNFNFFTIQS